MVSILTGPLADSWGMHGDLGTGWWIAMVVMMVLFWGAIILGIVWLARGGFGGWRPERRETPTEILERRFAEGEIPLEDYQQRREVIVSRADSGNGGDREADSPEASGKSEKAQS